MNKLFKYGGWFAHRIWTAASERSYDRKHSFILGRRGLAHLGKREFFMSLSIKIKEGEYVREVLKQGDEETCFA